MMTTKARVTLQALVAFRFDVIAKSEDEFSEWFHPELEGLTFTDTLNVLNFLIAQGRSELVAPQDDRPVNLVDSAQEVQS